MIEPPLGEFEGLRRCAASPPRCGDWPEAADDWQWCARFRYQVIERRGTGGGNFRLMYSRFLEEAGYDDSSLAAEAAEDWTSLALGRAHGQRARRGRPGALATDVGRRGEGARSRGAALDGACGAQLSFSC